MGLIEIDGRSQYRCDHWQNFAATVRAHLAQKNLPTTVLHFAIGGQVIPQDGKLHLLFDKDGPWVIPGAVEDREGDQRAQALSGKMYLRIWAVPDCPDQNGPHESVAVKALLDRLLPQVVESDPVKRAEMIRRAEEAQRALDRDGYVRECGKRFEKTLEGTRQKIAEGKKKIADLQLALTRAIRETMGCERKLQQMETCRGGEESKYGQEFDKLLEVPKVRRVEAKEGKVVIYTDVLYCVDSRSGKRHEIGAFRIELDTARVVPKWYNLTRKGPGNHMAPHVSPQGDACLGNTAEIFPQLIGEYEFAAAAMVAIQFVESVNETDQWGRVISEWPVAPA